MVGGNFSFILLHISTVLVFVLFVFILRMKNKKQIHYAFMSMMSLLFVWCVGHLLEIYTAIVYSRTIILYVYIYYFGLCFTPVSLLFTSLVFVKTKLEYSYKIFLLMIFPIVDYLIIVTNQYHNLFFIKYSLNMSEAEFGPLFTVHAVVSYAYMLIALYNFMFFSIKNSGFFSKQSLLIILSSSIPFFINILVTLNIISLPVYYTPIYFAFAVVGFTFAIFKFKFLNIAPIALQMVVDNISDGFVVINETHNIIDYNKTFLGSFKNCFKVVRNDNFFSTIESNEYFLEHIGRFKENIEKIRRGKRECSFEMHLKTDEFGKYFTVEFTPVFTKQIFIGSVILFKDITQSKKDFEVIKRNHEILMEQERLASLGQLIGGIAHNLRTSIMSIAGGIEGIRDLVVEYKESVGDRDVTEDDHLEIADDMKKWLDRMKPYCSYMSDVIDAVKGQTVQYDSSELLSFTIDELCKRIEILMNHELKKYHCKLILDIKVDKNMELRGEINQLVQVFDNIIINAIQAYEGKRGYIKITINKQNEQVLFMFEDKAGGIRPEIQGRLFREMTTTKGKNGTGLGLYMSYLIIKGRFGGDIWFETEFGTGTTFIVSIPGMKIRSGREVS